MYGMEIYGSPEFIQGMNYLSMKHVERPFLTWKDDIIPPSPEQLNKRIVRYANAYMADTNSPAIPIIWEAIQRGGSPDVLVETIDGKKEPLIVTAARNNAFFLVQALQAAGANIEAKSDSGETALGVATGKEVSSFLQDVIAGQKERAEAKVFPQAAPGFAAAAKVDPAEFNHGAMENKGLAAFRR